MSVSTRPIERRVRIRTVTDEAPETFRTEVRGETVDIQHVAIGRELDEPPAIRTEGDVTIIPIVEERLVIEKRLFLVEEVHVRRVERAEEVERSVLLKRQRVVVDKSETTEPQSEEH